MTVEASWCFLLECPSTPLQPLMGPGSLWRSSSGTGAQELGCPSPTAVSPAVAAVGTAVAAAAVVAVAAAAEFGAVLAGCRCNLCQRSRGGGSCSAGEPLEAWR